MFIVQVNASYKPAYIYGGPTMSVSKLCEELVKAGNLVEVLTTTANGEMELDVQTERKLLVDGVPVTYFRRITKGNSHFSPALLIFLWKALKNSKTTKVVHIHAWWNLVSIGSCLIALLKCRIVILSPRGTLSKYSFGNRKSLLKNIFHQTIGKTLLTRCHFHLTSVKEQEDLLSLLKPRSTTLIPNFVKVVDNFLDRGGTSVKAVFNQNSGTFNMIFLSRIEEKKGLNILFEAMAQLKFHFHLTIAGTGNPDYIQFLKTMSAGLKLSDKISWIGQQNNEQKFDILHAHDLMVLPSHDESFANVVIESLCVGTPVLVSKKVGLSDYVKSNNLGWEYEDSGDNLAIALTTAFDQEERRNNIRKTAPQQISIDFDENKIVSQYLQMYQTLFRQV